MLVKTRNITLLSSALAALFLIAVSLSTCDSPLGFGDAIDFEAPALTLDPGSNPRYVRQGTQLTGSVSDNVMVDRVILRDAVTGEVLFTARLVGGNPANRNWEIDLEFSEERNGEKLAVEIVAYDKVGNSGDASIAAVSLIIDIRPPFATEYYIERTSTGNMRRANLASWADIYALEKRPVTQDNPTGAGLDPQGERSAYADRYQNGWFKIKAKLDEEETRIQTVKLNLYDATPGRGAINPEDPLLSLDIEEGSTLYLPTWFLKEEDIIAAGQAKWGDYNARYYGGERYYYQAAIVANDRSENELHDDIGYFCLWYSSDFPKGILDPAIAGVGSSVMVSRGSTLPIDFFEDDSLEWAYAGLLSQGQWDGKKTDEETGVTSDVYIASGVKIPQFPGDPQADEKKLEWLKNRLRNNDTVYNWRYDKYYTQPSGTSEKLEELIDPNNIGTTLEDKIHYVQTGNNDSDYGAFVLVTFAGDKKIEPHDISTPAKEAALKKYKSRVWYVQVIDENEPLIVFDTVDTTAGDYNESQHPGGGINEHIPAARTGDSPEENTFPRLTGGRYFEINGYTLRENGSGNNGVLKFRMAWVPYGLLVNKTEAQVKQTERDVQNALKSSGFTPGVDSTGVQYWDLHSTMIDGTPDQVGGIDFKKQVFKKTFDILGASASNPSPGIALANYKDSTAGKTLTNPVSTITNETHFVYDSKLENETKLFIFYAEDNMGHEVYRQLRLLGNKTPPALTVYNITGYPDIDTQGLAPPDIYAVMRNQGKSSIDDAVRTAYRAALATYQTTSHGILQTICAPTPPATPNPPLSGYVSEPLLQYPRDTMLKYWVTAQEAGDLSVGVIAMTDITSASVAAGHYANGALSYVESLPEVTSRNFRFTATDTLGNEAIVQRTVSVTNAAVLSEITSPQENGIYGISKTDADDIILRAQFTNQVRWQGTNPPRLNVRYRNAADSAYVYASIPTSTPASSNAGSLFLEFRLKVGQGFRGKVETLYDNYSDFGFATAQAFANETVTVNNIALPINRPISLPPNTQIMDHNRDDAAFIPKYGTGANWTNANNSLQGTAASPRKNIQLDGIRPVIDGNFTVSGKTSYTPVTSPNTVEYHFRTGETITFTLTASDTGTSDNAIYTYRPAGQTTGNPNPRIRFRIGAGNTDYYADFQRNDGATKMIFSTTVPTSNATLPEGRITINTIMLNTAQGYIGDSVGNYLASTANTTTGALLAESAIPAPYPLSETTAIYIDKEAPPAPTTTLAGTAQTTGTTTLYYNTNPTLVIATTTTAEPQGIARTEYSLNNGLTWSTYPPNPPTVPVAPGAAWNSPNLTISNGDYTLQTRHVDKAGNEGTAFTRPISVNAQFPELKSVTVTQPSGTFIGGSSLAFNLTFEAPVYATAANPANVTITLTNRTNNNANGNPSYQMTLNATNMPTTAANAVATITFAWNNLTGKEMLDGLYISAVNFAGLRDRYANVGLTGSASYNSATPAPFVLRITNPGNPNPPPGPYTYTYDCPNLAAGYIVDCIAPTVNVGTSTPVNANGRAVDNRATSVLSAANNTITLQFSENMAAGSGNITIKPHGNYFIPPVFEHEGYYLGTDGNKYTDQGSAGNRTWVAGMSDIFNNVNNNDKTTLIGGTSISAPPKDARTGREGTPYVRITQGLKRGAGYTGNYSSTDGNNGPFHTDTASTSTAYMIPDTATKWVLDWRYSINNAANSLYTPATADNPTPVAASTTVVPAIRTVLTAAKFRWQEIDVTSTAVVINNNNTVTITLPQPLLKGLEWDLCYPEGAFEDRAGNKAAALNYENNAPQTATTATGYWFISSGAQTPVIRVNRKSFDARTSNWAGSTGGSGGNNNSYVVPTDREAAYPSAGWGINDFSTVHYRIETETPNATIAYGTIREQASDSSTSSVAIVHNTAVATSWNANVPGGSINWTSDAYGTSWARPNLIRRTATSATVAGSYSVYENGVSVTRNIQGTYRGFRSHNKDATPGDLNGVTLGSTINAPVSPAPTAGAATGLFFTYYPTEASKSYVVATATINNGASASYTSDRGYEGVFRSVIALWQQSNNTGTVVEGSNIKNGMPSIAGFPVQDAAETGDNRFIKVFHYRANGNHGENLWISTEIVSQWDFIKWGGGNTHQNVGDKNNYLTAGYGDLSFGYHITPY